MTLEVWLTYVLAVGVFCLMPGPTVILVIGQSLNEGKKSALPLASGVLLGDFVAMVLSLIGLGALLTASATLFLILKWLGVIYLLFLGVKTWRAEPGITGGNGDIESINKGRIFRSAFLVSFLNPKQIIFFVAFIPQFINASAAVSSQLIILMLTYLIVGLLNITFYSVFAGVFSQKVQCYKTRLILNRVGGGALVGAGLVTAATQQA